MRAKSVHVTMIRQRHLVSLGFKLFANNVRRSSSLYDFNRPFQNSGQYLKLLKKRRINIELHRSDNNCVELENAASTSTAPPQAVDSATSLQYFSYCSADSVSSDSGFERKGTKSVMFAFKCSDVFSLRSLNPSEVSPSSFS